MNSFVSDVRPYAELAYFLAGIMLVIGLFITRSQLYTLRSDMRIRSERSSKEKSIEACQLYFINYVSEDGNFFKKYREEGLVPFRGKVGNFTVDSLDAASLQNAIKRSKLEEVVPSLNTLELISSYFVSGVADEKTGFQIIGKSFCGTVTFKYDVITILRSEDNVQPYWFNIVELYKIWNGRFERENLRSGAAQIQEKLQNLPEHSVHAIGCD